MAGTCLILGWMLMAPGFRDQAGTHLNSSQNSAIQDSPPPKLLVGPDPVLMGALTVGVGAGRSHWISAASVLLAGGEDHFQVWSLEGTWNSARGRKLRAVAELVLPPGTDSTLPWTTMAQIQSGQMLDFWTVTDPLVLKKIPASLLSLVRDDRGIPSPKEDDQEVEAYWQTILLASRSEGQAFTGAVQKDLTRADLMNQPVKNRGKVVRISGRLVRLRKIEPSTIAAQAGIPTIFEGWIITEAYGANPACVIVTSLPKGMVPGETLDEEVVVDGYFFKRYRYESAGPGPDGTPYRKAPLVIGHEIRLNHPESDPVQERLWVSRLLPWLLVIVAGSAALVFGLTYWLNRGDEKVRRRIRELRGASIEKFLESGEEYPEPPVVLTKQENEHRNRRWTTPSEN